LNGVGIGGKTVRRFTVETYHETRLEGKKRGKREKGAAG
jgi:hypothetical protein